MIRFVTFDELRTVKASVSESVLRKAASSAYGKTAFLSHSHHDNDILPGVITVLENHGGRVYVDLRDEGLPDEISAETAVRLHTAINSCKRFVLLVTPRSRDSRWIPWELGISDGTHSESSVALFPSTDTMYDERWADREYLGLYRRIIWGNFTGQDEEWLVYNHRDNNAIRLRDWLTQ